MSSTEAEIDHLRSDIHKLRTDIEHLGATLARVVQAGVREAGDSVRDLAKAPDAYNDAVKRVRQTINDKPLPSALTALGIGLLLGWACSPRRG